MLQASSTATSSAWRWSAWRWSRPWTFSTSDYGIPPSKRFDNQHNKHAYAGQLSSFAQLLSNWKVRNEQNTAPFLGMIYPNLTSTETFDIGKDIDRNISLNHENIFRNVQLGNKRPTSNMICNNITKRSQHIKLHYLCFLFAVVVHFIIDMHSRESSIHFHRKPVLYQIN